MWRRFARDRCKRSVCEKLNSGGVDLTPMKTTNKMENRYSASSKNMAEKMLFSAIIGDMGIPPPPPVLTRAPAITEPITARPKNRCGECKRKLLLSDLTCTRCDTRYCGHHRLPEEHRCCHDFRAEGKVLLEAANPVVRADKLVERI